MKRAVIFAHYDKNREIKDYVLYYLKELKKTADTIIFVSCCDLKNACCLNGLADKIIAEQHNEYDFGSYKRGFLFLQDKLDDYDELIFANDSCYGPLYQLQSIFDSMDNCDFWGITKNNYGYKKNLGQFFVKRPHIQSYFVVFKKNVFTKSFFADFIKSIKHEESKKLVISNYEIGLTELLVQKGYRYKTLINAYENINNVTILKWREIIEKCQMPFIKKSLFDLKNTDAATIEGYEKLLGNFPKSLIDIPRKVNKKVPFQVKKFIFGTLANFPFVIRKSFAILINKLFPFVKD
ncbi:MAG TPA: hypothetical protein IAD11_02200 [Candidatus Stercorousia faecigallinarum]|nr:hypothetical protein [Candidatus Stercorousia faecigallinarum]